MKRPWLDANSNTFPYRKLIHVASLKARIGWQSLRTEEFIDEGPYCVTGTDFKNGKVDWSTAYHVSKERYEMDRNIQLTEGDLLVTKDGTIGKVAVVHGMDTPATLNSGVFVVRPKNNDLSTDFLGWVIRSKVFDDFVAFNFSGSTINHLYQNVFETFRFPFPALTTQRQIADFLDRETARIDLLIEKKQRLVALLGEKAQAKKLDLVTGQRRGEQKETSILWAPSIPKHWEERAVWMLFELGRGRVMSHEYIAENEGEYPIYSSQTANDGVMGYINTYDFEGDYLTWTTDGAKAGTVFRRRGKFNCTNVCGTLKPLTRSIDLNYAQVALDTATDFFVRHDINPKLMNGVMSKIRIPYPPLDEQRKVGEVIDQIEQSYKPILEKNQISIDRLKEYRSALITAAVTGQIDVSTYAKSGTTDRRLDAIQEEMGA